MNYLFKTWPLPFYVCPKFNFWRCSTMSMHRVLPDMDCLQSHQKYNKLLTIHNDKCSKFQWGILWAKPVENWLDKLHLHGGQIIFLASSTPQTHARKPSRFPSARQDVMGRPRSTFWCGRSRVVPHWGRGGASLRSATVFRNRIPQPYSVSLKHSQTEGGKQPYSEKCRHSSTKKIDPRSARLNYVPTQTWNRQAPISHPIRKQKPYDYKHMPKQHGNIKYSIQTNTQLPAKTWKLTFKNQGVSSGLRDHTWTWFASMHIAKHANTKHTSMMRLGIEVVISNVWVSAFAHALLGTQWGTDVR